jgi:hypothetical protein
MEESLKAARLIHHLIVITTAAMFVFAVSSEKPPDIYGKALTELRALRTTVVELPSLNALPLSQHYQASGVLTALRDELESPSLMVRMPQDRSADLAGDVEHQKLTTLYEFLLEMPPSQKVDLWDVDVPDLRNKLRQAASDRTLLGSVYEANFFGDNGDPEKPQVVLATRTPSSSGFSKVDIRVVGRRLVESSAARQIAIARGLIVSEHGTVVALSSLRPVWGIVSSLNLGEAEQALERRDKEVRRSDEEYLSVLGLTIRTSVAVILAPVLLMALLLYLYAHIQHIATLASGQLQQVQSFPWIALFTSRLGRALSVLSLVVLPPLSAITIAIASSPLSTRMLVSALVANVGLTTLAVFLCWQLLALARIATANRTIDVGHQPNSIQGPP